MSSNDQTKPPATPPGAPRRTRRRRADRSRIIELELADLHEQLIDLDRDDGAEQVDEDDTDAN